jgi:hypothetical protein
MDDAVRARIEAAAVKRSALPLGDKCQRTQYIASFLLGF